MGHKLQRKNLIKVTKNSMVDSNSQSKMSQRCCKGYTGRKRRKIESRIVEDAAKKTEMETEQKRKGK